MRPADVVAAGTIRSSMAPAGVAPSGVIFCRIGSPDLAPAGVTPAGAIPADWAGGSLTIDLGAIVANWRTLAAIAHPAECAAVLKADAYGLGVAAVAPVLAAAGCRSFFVAHLGEGIALRDLLGPDPSVFVLNGIPPGTAPEFDAHRLLPVLNSLGQVAEWQRLAASRGRRLPATLQVDTGMSRFGLSPEEVQALGGPDGYAGIDVRLVMSHLGCADEPSHPANESQRAAFARLRPLLPAAPASLAASYGIFLGPAFRLDMVRPGVALFGVPPGAGRPNPLRATVRLQGRIVQTRWISPGAFVGYGARFVAERPSRIATVAIGYADGFLRAGGERGVAFLPGGGPPLPIVGRISMDCLGVDVTDAPDPALGEGMALDLIGPHRPVEAAAAAAGTIAYEMLTALGHRYHRHYLDAPRG